MSRAGSCCVDAASNRATASGRSLRDSWRTASPRRTARETWEEARALVDDLRLFTLFNLPHINQVYTLFRARLAQPGFDVSDESLETRLFSADELPWDEMAFPVVAESLKLYLADRAGGGFRLHSGNLIRLPGEAVRFRVEMHE